MDTSTRNESPDSMLGERSRVKSKTMNNELMEQVLATGHPTRCSGKGLDVKQNQLTMRRKVH